MLPEWQNPKTKEITPAEEVWVNFKLFGGAGFMLIFVFIQAMYLTRHAIEQPTEEPHG